MRAPATSSLRGGEPEVTCRSAGWGTPGVRKERFLRTSGSRRARRAPPSRFSEILGRCSLVVKLGGKNAQRARTGTTSVRGADTWIE
jgi:hypothetical protein